VEQLAMKAGSAAISMIGSIIFPVLIISILSRCSCAPFTLHAALYTLHLIMTLHTFPIVPVPMTPYAGSWVDASIDLMLDNVVTPVWQVTIRTVTAF
jgi:hypothetical protein